MTEGPGAKSPGLSGRVLEGRYRVGAVIARGGMSTVYRGMDTRLDRAVAIKVMHAGYAADPDFVDRFHREARAAAGLRSPHVVAVYDQGTDFTSDQSAVFLVMELIDGGTLRDLLRSGPLDVPVTLAVLEQVLAALAAAHAAGLVHRDVKPENVLISSRGEVKVADFGLVRTTGAQTRATGNVILGTVAYLSPEQVATGASDARSDVYSAGLVAYEMLTGHPPFDGDNAINVAYKHVHTDVPPVTDEAPNVPLELDELILAATRRDPDRRPRDAAAFLAAVIGVRTRLRLPRVLVPTPQPRAAASSAAPTDRAGRGGTRLMPAVGPHTDLIGQATTARVAADRARSGPPSTDALDAQRRRKRRWRRWLVASAVIVLLAVAAALGGWWLGSGRWATMPATVGLDRQHAVAMVQAAGLTAGLTTAADDTVADGSVVRTDPTAGTRRPRGSETTLVVSTGRPAVPAIAVGTTVDLATTALTAARLTARTDTTQDQYSVSVAAGLVVGTAPVSGTRVKIGTPITLIRSKGKAPVAVPEVAGKSLDDAQNALMARGFTLGKDEKRFSADVADGSVLSSDPASGVLAPSGSAVSLVRASSLTVPDVRGQTAQDARATLRSHGFTPTDGIPTFDSAVAGGSVMGTDPVAGTRIDPANPTVALNTSTAVTVPPVVGLSRSDAEQQLSDLGLTADYSSFLTFGSSTVYSQNPHAGDLVAPGSAVELSLLP